MPKPVPAPSTTLASVAISSAELLTIASAPKQLVPAPGTGLVVQVVSATVAYTHGGVSYANVGSPDFYYGASRMFTGSNFSYGFSQSSSQFMSAALDAIANPLADCENKAVFFSSNNNFTNGNGTAVVNVIYQVVPV